MGSGRKILVVGSGGREHALAARLADSPTVSQVIVAPGNAGTVGAAHGRLKNATGDPVDIAVGAAVDLVVVGPEAPLCAGLVDRLARAGVPAFGPSASAARLEGSKAFMKDFAARIGLVSARYAIVKTEAEARNAVRSFSAPPVVKADGLCAGKGVVVAATHEEALDAALHMLSGEPFGDAGRTVVIEERIEGAEASVHALSDGERLFVLPAAQDHKRIFDGDRGANTGGMGAYAPAPLVSVAMMERIRAEFLEPTIRGMAEIGAPYRGALFAGFMITPAGEPYLLEYNVRLGDPETEVLLNVLDGDLADAFDAAAHGRLSAAASGALRNSSRHAVCVVLAAANYPGKPRTGDAISGLEAASALDGVRVYHAGTRRDGDRVVTAGGRVLAVTGRGASLREAHDRAYAGVECIRFDGMQYRTDIGHRALGSSGSH
ncbi:MAG TPA: phosphoribosylamine--glycine ligase [Polyangiaceae bacterium]|jgi:phosphoribosylamine--glycine ligase|nr:phosphoribosylamine--glycine ligase [Polyangiaceae bacterium]